MEINPWEGGVARVWYPKCRPFYQFFYIFFFSLSLSLSLIYPPPPGDPVALIFSGTATRVSWGGWVQGHRVINCSLPFLSHFSHLLKVVVEMEGFQVAAVPFLYWFPSWGGFTNPGTECKCVSFLEGISASWVFTSNGTVAVRVKLLTVSILVTFHNLIIYLILWLEDPWWTKHSLRNESRSLRVWRSRKSWRGGYDGNGTFALSHYNIGGGSHIMVSWPLTSIFYFIYTLSPAKPKPRAA